MKDGLAVPLARVDYDEQAAILSHQALALIDRPVITLASDGGVVMINAAGERLIARSAALHIVDGRLLALDAPLDSRLREAIACSVEAEIDSCEFTYLVVRENEDPGSHDPVRKPADAARVTARGVVVFAAIGVTGAHGVRHCLLIASLGPPGRTVTQEQLRKSFGLTPTEAALAVDISHGLDTAGMAARRGVKAETIRVHVKAISAKMNCHGKNDIIRIVLALPRLRCGDDE